MGRGLEIGDEKEQREQHQQRRGDVHGQIGQRDDGKHSRQPAHDPGQDQARVRELGDDAVSGDDDE